MIITGTTKDLVAQVHNRVTGKIISAGTMYCISRLESTDSDDGKLWNGTAWVTTPVSYPLASGYTLAGWWYRLPVEATTGKTSGTVHYTYMDNIDPNLAVTVCAGGEHIIATDAYATPDDVEVIETEPSLR